MPYSQSWLEDSTSIRGILIELTVKTISTGVETPVYLSNIGYVTADSSISYLPIISGGVQFTENLPVGGQPAISFGDIAINNSTGELDVWLDYTKYIWANRAIQIYLGDPSWICQNLTEVHTQFEKIFDGVIADVDSVDRNTLNIKIRDKLDRLNVPLTDVKLGVIGTWGAGQSNIDTIRPVIFGEVFNFTPLLIDPSQLEYMFCKDASSYNFTTNVLIPPAGWSVTQPATTTTPTYACDFTFSGAAGTTVTSTGSWSTPYVEAVNGSNGTNGEFRDLIELYLASGTAPTAPTSVQYTFTGNVLGTVTGGTAGWSMTQPATTTTPTYITKSLAATTTPGTAVTLTTWSSPVVVAQNGTSDNSVFVATVYQQSASAPATPAATASELIIELRDNGVPIYTHNGTTAVLSSGATVTLNTGRFKLTTNLVGTLTASAQGVNNSINLTTGALVTGTYVNNIANLIALITTQYGVNKLTAGELDLTNLQAFSTANTQSVGILVQDTSSVLNVCQQLANSIGAQVFMNRKGKLQLLRIGSNTTDAVVNITEDHIINQSLSISNRTIVVASKTVAFNKNWTVQKDLLSSIYPEDKSNFNTEHYTKTALNQAVQTNYKLPATDVEEKIDSLLLVQAEADTEATRLNTLYTIPRTIYKFTGTAGLLSLKLGQGVTLTHRRFNLTSATAGQVVTLSPNWLTSTIDVEVLV